MEGNCNKYDLDIQLQWSNQYTAFNSKEQNYFYKICGLLIYVGFLMIMLFGANQSPRLDPIHSSTNTISPSFCPLEI